MKKNITLTINGEEHLVAVDAKDRLLDVIRDKIHLTGTKEGCGTGECGACTVLIDGEPINACLYLAIRAEGKDILTIEGLGDPTHLHPLQLAFVHTAAVQCGFCAPGMLLTAKALLDKNPHPSEKEIREGIAGNLCRCTGYANIIKAIQLAATLLADGHSPTDDRHEPHPIGAHA